MQTINKELSREEEFNKSLDRIVVALRRIQLRDTIPADFDHVQKESLECAALDLCASVCNYLTLSLKYFRRSFMGSIPTDKKLIDKEIFSESALVRTNSSPLSATSNPKPKRSVMPSFISAPPQASRFLNRPEIFKSLLKL